MASRHEPVLYHEVLLALNLAPGDKVIDGTAGGGGHLAGLLNAVGPTGQVMGIDADPKAINLIKQKFFNDQRLILINSWFSAIQKYVQRFNFEPVAAILLDLGWSADQLADTSRGFSFNASGQLDFRYNPQTTVTAEHILNTATAEKLAEIFKNLGDEPRAKAIARSIVKQRQVAPLKTTDDLRSAVAAVYRRQVGKLNPATRVWQALRLATNQELEELTKVLPVAVNILKPGGRLAVISFHSGEDRIVKNFFARASKDCLCPPEVPVCKCGHKAILKLISRGVTKPTDQEIRTNPRSRSARLRVAAKI